MRGSCKLALAMSSENLWLAVKVLSGPKMLFGSKIIQCSVEESFGHLLSRLEGESFAERTVELVKIGEGTQQHEVQLNAPLQLCSNFSCKAIEYRLASVASSAEKPSKNAFALAEDDLVRSLKDEYAVVRPICFLCRSDGKRPATWGASNVSKRAKN